MNVLKSIGFRPSFLATLGALCLTPTSLMARSQDPLGYQSSFSGQIVTEDAKAHNAMVVSAQHLATEAGLDILKAGGNAVDAAVAVGYALAVVYPGAGNIGGGGFATVRLPDGKVVFIDFREHAPLAASATMYQDKSGNVKPSESVEGWKAVAVPGTVAGLNALEKRWGKLGLPRVMAPAIRLARVGYSLDIDDVDLLRLANKRFKRDRYARQTFLKAGGEPFEVGDVLVQKDLATTLRLISAEGDAGFYSGHVAETMVEASRQGGGILSMDDLKAYKVRTLKPLHCNYRGYSIDTAPPPSGGGVAICEVLNVLSKFDLKRIGLRSAEGVRLQVEAMRHAYSDRRDLGDPDFVNNPVAHFDDAAYGAEIAEDLPSDHAVNSLSLVPGQAAPSKSALATSVSAPEKRETTQFSTADKDGYAVSITYTLNGWFGAHVVAGSAGFLMNDEMDDFSSKPGTPNMYGIVGSRANEIAPGKTPLSSMSPTIISRGGKLFMVIGSPGGSRIPTVVLNVMLGVIDGGMGIQEAINMPRIHEQWLPSPIDVEPGALSADVADTLRKEGYKIVERPQRWGLAQGILAGCPKGDAAYTGLLYGGADQRHSGGLAKGF